MEVPSEYTGWVEAKTWVSAGPIPSFFTPWAEGTTWMEGGLWPSFFTEWIDARTWTSATTVPSLPSTWVEARTWQFDGRHGWRREGPLWVELGEPQRLVGSSWVGLSSGETVSEDLDRMIFGSSATPSADHSKWMEWNAELVNTGSKPGGVNNGLAVRRTFTSGNVPTSFQNTPAWPDVAEGVASIWSCKPPSIAAINNGSEDARWTGFFNSIPDGHRAFLTFWHEPWNDFEMSEWPAFREAQKRVYRLLKESNANPDLVKWGLIGTSGDFRAGNHLHFFPEDGSFDWIGVDGYDYYRDPTAEDDAHPQRGKGRTRTPHQIFGGATGFVAETGKPLVVGEFSFHPDPNYPDGPLSPDGVPSRPYRLQATIDYFLEHNAIAVCMFHNDTGSSGPWWFDCFHNWTNKSDRSARDEATLKKVRDILAVYGKP